MTALARLEHVTRRFGDILALDAVDLEIDAGSITGLLGPNGAGKSTLLALLQGLRRPTSGRVSLFGGDPRDPRSRRLLGTTPQDTALPDTLRVGEVIEYVGGHFSERADAAVLAEQFGLTDLLRRQCGSLSGGQRRRVAVALAFAGNPRLVLLDEPTTGLDVDGRRVLWQAIRDRHAEGVAVVVTSHYLEEIEALAERVVVIAGGRVLADDALHAIVGRVATKRMLLHTPEPAALHALPGVASVEGNAGGPVTLTVRDADEVVRALVRRDLPFAGLEVRPATLEEAFLALTHDAEGARA